MGGQRRQRAATLATTGGASGRSSNTCPVCDKTVYAMEEVKVEGQSFCKRCFRCNNCNKMLNAGNYASYEGKVYANCFMKLFKSAGNYDTGFGSTPRKMAWKSEYAGC